jgi:5'-nucleotidase
LPNLPLDKIKGIELTRLARRNYNDLIKEGYDGKRKYYWIVRGEPRWNMDHKTDIRALEEGKISITPLHSDLTSAQDVPFIEDLSSLLL